MPADVLGNQDFGGPEVLVDLCIRNAGVYTTQSLHKKGKKIFM